MNVSRERIDRAERSLSFDPRSVRRALVERAPAADAHPTALQRRIAHVLGEGAGGAPDLAIERLVYGGDPMNVNFLERGMIAADAVTRIEVFDDESQLVGHGTGFMISPQLLLTNRYVLATPESAARSWADFRHEYDALGRPVEPTTFALDPATFFFTDVELDITVVAVSPRTPDGTEQVASFGWLRLSASDDTVLPGEWLSVVHHPGGRPKQVALRQNLLVDAGETELWYVTETAPGSSGAPVFNDSWQVVAVHSLGAPARDRGGEILTLDGGIWSPHTEESDIVWRASVGTRASAIVRRLAVACGSHPLVQELLREGDVDAAEAIVIPLGAGRTRRRIAALRAGGNGAIQSTPTSPVPEPRADGNGNGARTRATSEPPPTEAITITVPLRITLRANDGAARAPAVGVTLT